MQMGVAAVVHLYVFPAKPYELIGDRFVGDVSVLGDYASVDCPLDPDEVKDSERPTKFRLPQPDDRVRCSTAIKESVRDVVLGGGEYVRGRMLIYLHLFYLNYYFFPMSDKVKSHLTNLADCE